MQNTIAPETPSPNPLKKPITLTWRPIVIVTALTAALHYGLWLLLDMAAPDAEAWHRSLAIYLVLSALVMPAGLIAMRISGHRLALAFAWVGMLAMGLFSSLLVLALLRALAITAVALVGASSAQWGPASAELAVVLAVLATLVGLFVARAIPAVVRVDIPLADLPPALEGFQIAQITDIHVGATIRRGYLQRIVTMVNALEADLIAITGDVVDGDVDTLRRHVAPLRELRANAGVALVLGNHEIYSGAPAWVTEFQRLGLHVLLNAHYLVERADATLAVAGVTDHTTGRFFPEWACDPARAIAGAGQAADVRNLLAHQPVTAPEAAAAGYHLALHGHTHGGQWWPWNYFVRLQQPVVRGLHRFGSMWSYTSVGTGYWGPPKRHFRSEITLLTLRRLADAR